MKLDITFDEILEDLCHNGLPPGRWNVPQSPNSAGKSSGTRATYSGWREMYPLTNGQNGNTDTPAERASSSTAAIS
jgi:hypothetical protein